MSKFFKTVTDPIHGNIGLTKVEAEVMASAVMQRLHNVRQLGLAHLVYPGANYSRFSHSVGACHTAGNLLTAIEKNTGRQLPPKEVQEYRLVALLHDIGHYPFSHATETVISNFYAKEMVVVSDANPVQPVATESEPVGVDPTPPQSYHHEPLGEFVIRTDSELCAILKRNGFDPDEIADRFAKSKPDQLIGIISSDLDCDRLDYLKRTAHNSGAPYGSVDIRFLIDQATLDTDGLFCFKSKAARAADHLLVSRFYDYMQIPFNKTVAGLEWSLNNSLEQLLKKQVLNCSGSDMEQMVRDNEWKRFDDQSVMANFRALSRESGIDSVVRDHLSAILDRKPAKLIASWDEVTHSNDLKSATQAKYIAGKLLKEVAQEFSLDERRLFIWDTPVKFTKIDLHGPSSQMNEEDLAEAVQVLDDQTGRADLLVRRKDTLVHRLCSYRMAGLRLYYLPDNGEMDTGLKARIVTKFSEALGKPVNI